MKVYISLPITGKDEKEQREKADKIKMALSKAGYEVINPFDIVPDKKNPDWYDYIGADLRELAKCDKIYLCKGWKESKGCNIEMQYAVSMGIKPMFESVEPVEIYYR